MLKQCVICGNWFDTKDRGSGVKKPNADLQKPLKYQKNYQKKKRENLKHG